MRRCRLCVLALCLFAWAPVTADASLLDTIVDCAIPRTPSWACNPTSAFVTSGGGEFLLVLDGTPYLEVDLNTYSMTLYCVALNGLSANAGEANTACISSSRDDLCCGPEVLLTDAP